STASYEAREHGVHSGLPLRTAARRLPDAVFLPVDRAAYEEISETVMEVLRSTGAVVEVLGWDEAFVGVDTEDPEGFARSLARPGRRRGGRLAVPGQGPRPGGDVPAEHRRLAAGGGRGGADSRAAGSGPRFGAAAGAADRGEGALRALHHRDARGDAGRAFFGS